jgi:hypothetical protein
MNKRDEPTRWRPGDRKNVSGAPRVRENQTRLVTGMIVNDSTIERWVAERQEADEQRALRPLRAARERKRPRHNSRKKRKLRNVRG